MADKDPDPTASSTDDPAAPGTDDTKPPSSPPADKADDRSADLENRLADKGRKLAETEKRLADLEAQIADEKRTDAERVEHKVQEAERIAAAATKRADAAEQELEVFKAAGRKGADPELAYALIAANPTRYAITTNEDGNLEGIDEAVEKLLEDKPTVKAGAPSQFTDDAKNDGGPRGGGPDQITKPEDLDKMSPEEINKAFEDGRLNSMMGADKPASP